MFDCNGNVKVIEEQREEQAEEQIEDQTARFMRRKHDDDQFIFRMKNKMFLLDGD